MLGEGEPAPFWLPSRARTASRKIDLYCNMHYIGG